MHMYFTLTRTVEMLPKINSSVCISLLDMCASYPQPLLLAHRWIRQNWKEKKNYGLPYLSFSFFIIVFSISDWLPNGCNTSKKGSWSFVVFLEHYCLLSTFKANSGWYGKHHFSGLSTPLLTQLQTWHIFHRLSLCSCWAQTRSGIPEFCAHGVPWAL